MKKKLSKTLSQSLFGVLLLMSFMLSASGLQAKDEKLAKTPELKITSYDWEGKITPSRLVILKNPYGSIRSRNHSEEKVRLHATSQVIGEKGIKPDFKITENKDFLEIEVVYAEPVVDAKGNLRGRTDVSILFPDDVSIYAETDSGMIKIDKTASHVEAVSQSGDIKLTTTGLFKAKTLSGHIALRLRGQKLAGESSATSKSGNIKADIFSDMDLYLTAETSGKVLLNEGVEKSGLIYQQGSNLSHLKFRSDSGDIKLNVIEPPALVKSVKPSNATSVDVDLRDLKKSKLWKPGEPIYDRDDKRDNSNKNKNNRNKDK